MERMKTVSVIVSAYNEERYIRQCLDSLISQTLDDMEIIVVNDASTDSTGSILAEYQARFPQIRVINLEHNLRQGGARNIGFKIAAGEYVAYCDADDWTDRSMYEKLYRKAAEENFDSVGCYYWKHHENSDVSPRMVIRGWCRIYKRSVIIENRIFFPEKIRYEDIFFQKLARYYIRTDGVVPEYLYHYRSHPGSVTHSLTPKVMYEREKIELMILDTLEKRGLEASPFSAETNLEYLSRFILGNLQAWIEKVNAFPSKEHLRSMRELTKARLPEYKKYLKAFPPRGRLLLFFFFHSYAGLSAAARLFRGSVGSWSRYTAYKA